MSRKQGKNISILPPREELLLKALKDLEDKELKEFKWYLQKPEVLGRFPVIPKSKIDKADRPDTVDQMLQTYCDNTLEVTIKILKKLDRNDLVQIIAGPNSEPVSEGFPDCQKNLKANIRKRFLDSPENGKKGGKPKGHEELYTEMYLAIKESSKVSMEHEFRQIETASRKTSTSEKKITYVEIFRAPSGRDAPVKKVLTTGVAGIGKTLLTQKFTLDWADDRSNEDFHFTFLFSFRDLTVLKDKKFSLVSLIHHFFSETKEAEINNFEEFQVAFIFDGLDECRLPLDFRNNKTVTEITESTSVDVLLTNLIKGNLFSSARIWITTRPAAANQIPSECIDMVTEVLGFNEAQKLNYFRKRCRNESLVCKMMHYIKTSKTLNTMCNIPACCWITAAVLEEEIKSKEGGELPKTLTELYINFLLIQSKMKGVTDAEPQWNSSNKEKILTLGKLAFEQLQKGNVVFYESDLAECGINIKTVSIYTTMFNETFNEEKGSYDGRVFCFTHLSVQEFLAALYVHMNFVNSHVNLLDDQQQASWMSKLSRRKTHLHHSAVEKALQSSNGHLDLFLLFLVGLTDQTNQNLLKGLQKKNESNLQTNKDAVKFIKERLDGGLTTEKSTTLFYCLSELNDSSLTDEVQQSLKSGQLSVDIMSPAQWSALVFILLSSEKHLETFDLKKYSASEEAFLRLLPVIKTTKRVLLSSCNLSERSLEVVSSVLSSQNSRLKELDLSHNDLQDSGVRIISTGLESPNCSLETLRLSGCKLSWRSCETLASVLNSPHCCLKELDMSNNDLQDSGVQNFSSGLENPQCKLEILRLSGCQVTEEGCGVLVTALSTNPNHLKVLDLSYNHPGESGIRMLSIGVKNPKCRLETLTADHCGEQRLKFGLKKYACEIKLDPNTAHKNLKLSEDFKTVTVVREEQPYPDHPERFENCCWQVLGKNGLTGRSYWEVERNGSVVIAVCYKKTSRKGNIADCRLGWNDQYWSAVCNEKGYSFWHNKKETVVPVYYPSDMTNKIAVYVDYPAGIVSFYSVSPDALNHLHTFHTTFTAPVYPVFGFGFGFWSYDSSVSLSEK